MSQQARQLELMNWKIAMKTEMGRAMAEMLGARKRGVMTARLR